MAEKKKSIIEEALLEAKSLEDALKANTKEMLAAHMSKEFESIVESSLKGKDEEVTEDETEEVSEQMDDDAIEGSDDEKEEVVDLDVDEDEDEDEVEDMEDMEDMELDLDVDSDEDEVDDVELDLDTDLDLDAGEGEEEMGDVEMDLELPMDMEMGGEEVMDLTGASDDEVVKVFKKLSDDDEVEVVKDGDGIHLTDNETGAEYYIKESMDEMMNEKEYCSECGSGSMYEDESMDEVMYEIEMDEDSDMLEMMKEMEDMEEGHYEEGYHMEGEDMDEGEYIDEEEEKLEEDRLQRHRKFAGKQRYSGAKVGRRNESRKSRKPLVNRKPKTSTVSENKIMKEYNELKSKNNEYKKALNVFKDKLNEVALFNTNLAYVNRLFTEHSTTKKEKMDILKRFDNAETIKESKNIYKTVKTELDNKQPINESVERKVNKTVKSSKATNLNESTAYVDPQISAIKDLMRRIS
jgi:hypothetical protein